MNSMETTDEYVFCCYNKKQELLRNVKGAILNILKTKIKVP